VALDRPTRLTIVVGGHPFDVAAFDDMVAALDGVSATTVAWPDAETLFEPGGLDDTDVLALYDMPGVGLRRGAAPEPVPPSPVVIEGWKRLTERGLGVLALHHALAGWPAWPDFADIVGGRFHYAPARLWGVDWPDSGYRHNVAQRLARVDADHPLLSGIPDTFELVDETYLCPIDERDSMVLLRSDAPRTADAHYSSAAAVTGRRDTNDGWHHPNGSTAAMWTRSVGRSNVVYLQPGDGPSAFTNPHYRTLITNAVHWLRTAPTTDGA
jgi:uncharacterized protein